MTVRLIAPNGRAHTVYVRGARSASAAIIAAQAEHGADCHAAWVLPGDAR